MRTELLAHLLPLTLGSSLGIVAALALRPIVRRVFGASASYALWGLVPSAMLSVLLPHAHFTALQGPIHALPATTLALTRVLVSSFDSRIIVASAASDGGLWTLTAWGAGAVIFALYLIALQRTFVTSLGTLSGLHCVLRAENCAGSPALIGVLRPKVILPADFRARYTRLERLLVLSHERTHLRRGDAGWNALVALLRCIFWFNPLIHVGARYFRFDQELACDAAVLQARHGSRRPYASAMLKTQLTEGALPIGCHWRSAQDLKVRLRMVSVRAPNRRRRRIGAALTTLMAVVVAYTAWAAQPVADIATAPSRGASAGPQLGLSWTAGWSGWLSSLNQTPGQPVSIFTHHAQLFLPSGVKAATNADRVAAILTDATEHPQTTILEGHVHLAFTSPSVDSTGARTIIVETNRAVLVAQPGGGLVAQVEEGTIRTVPPGVVNLDAAQTFPVLLTPNLITPQFKDADISQVAAAVAVATHRTISVDPRVRVQLNMLSSTPMTPEAFYQSFVDILRTRGLVAVPVGPAGNVIRIQPGANE